MGGWKGRIWVVVHLAVLTVGAYLVADLVNLLIARQLEASIRSEDRAPGLPARATALVPDPAAYQRILEGNLFQPALRGQTSAPVMATIAPVTPLDLPVSLVGTGEAEGVPSFAVLEDRTTREQQVYRLHDVVRDGAVLAKVERNQIVLRRDGQQQILVLYTDGTEDVTPSAVNATPRGAGIGAGSPDVKPVPTSTNRWVLDKQEVAAALNNLPQLLTKARVIPNFTDGKPDGFKIFSIAPDSLYAKIGLQNGDVLQQINGVEIKDPENFMRVFQQLKDETNIALDFVRNSRRESFSYEIR
jgi:general secretion pathway protein C